jgi:hypothetical protein
VQECKRSTFRDLGSQHDLDSEAEATEPIPNEPPLPDFPKAVAEEPDSG